MFKKDTSRPRTIAFSLGICFWFCVCSPNRSLAQLKAFPGAEGFGTDTVHGRGGRVIRVTNLNASGDGSFKAACEAQGPRIVVFDIGGIIDLGNSRIFVEHPYLYIAGQTAPGDGICLKNGPLVIHTHDVLVRYIRSRPGDAPDGYEKDNRDGITIDGDYDGDGTNFYNIVIDHCSTSWATDENMSTWFPLHDVTFSWNIIAEGLQAANHPKDPTNHSMGLLIGESSKNISVHHNYFISNDARNPRLSSDVHADVVNNVVYNFGQLAMNPTNVSGANFVKNHIKKGPNSSGNTSTGWSAPYELYETGGTHDNSIFLEGNIGWNRTNDTQDEWAITNVPQSSKANTRFSSAAVTEVSAVDVVSLVLSGAGATAPRRDSVDARLVSEYAAGTGGIIDSQDEVGGLPAYNSATPPTDTDGDGMPDSWEASHGLNPQDAADGSTDRDHDGYTNIEEYINSLTSDSPPQGGDGGANLDGGSDVKPDSGVDAPTTIDSANNVDSSVDGALDDGALDDKVAEGGCSCQMGQGSTPWPSIGLFLLALLINRRFATGSIGPRLPRHERRRFP